MKKIISVLLLSMTLFIMGCTNQGTDSKQKEENSNKNTQKSIAPKKSDKNKKEDIIFYSDLDETFQVTLVDGWEAYNNPTELLEVANLSFHNKKNAFGVIAISQANDFENFEVFQKTSKEALEIPENDTVEQEVFEAKGFNGTRYIYDDTLNGIKVRYAMYIIEGENEFIEAQLWSTKSTFSKYLESGNLVLESITKKQ